MKLKEEDMAMLTDASIAPQGLKHSYVSIETENTKGEVVRQKEYEEKNSRGFVCGSSSPRDRRNWFTPRHLSWFVVSVDSRFFRGEKLWRLRMLPKKRKRPKRQSAAPSIVDFLVTKVWIEPGCIVCDACENEAPAVFKVLADTCIVVENADISDGAAVKAAAEGCPVDVIKYTTIPKPAA